ncbi:Pentatricopeptide repeat-containing protein At1g19720 [Linum perenne]
MAISCVCNSISYYLLPLRQPTVSISPPFSLHTHFPFPSRSSCFHARPCHRQLDKMIVLSLPMPHFSSNPPKPDNPPEISFVPPGKSSVSHSGKPHAAANADSYLTYLCRNERLSDAVNALDSLAQAKLKTATLIELLQSCIDSKSLDLGRKIHARIDLAEDQSVFVWTKLVGMYAKCGSFVDARKVFDGMRERNLYTWSAIIAACCRENRWEEAMDLFYSMMRDGILPDGFLLPKILQACANCEDYETGRLIHSLVIKCGHGSYPLVNNSILSMYAKCGKLELALLLFHCIDKTNIVAWNTLMNGYCLKGEIDEAVNLFNAMCKEGVAPNSLTWTILLTGYHNIGHCDAALDIMKTMESFGIKTDVVAWTSVISGYAQSNGQQSRAISLFKEMISAGAQPNEVTIAVVISVCAYMRWLNNGLEIHAFAVKMGFIDDNVFVGNSFIDFYSKCEKLDAAQEVFDMMPEKNALTWNSMIGGYIEAGYWRKAYDLFTRMQKSDIQPNVVTWNTLISGLMQNGDEEEAIDMFYRMEKDAKTKCDIVTWNALIAGYSKMGQKEKAVRVFRQMLSYGFSPNTVSILSVLPAVANLITLQNVKELHGAVLRRNLEASISISNSLIDSYANSGKLEYSRTLFEKMKRKDPITWDSMTAAYIAHGCSDTALTLVDDMLAQGLPPNQGTFVNMILAHSLNGNVDGGKHELAHMIEEYQLTPTIEIYSAMIDLYGRVGRLEEAIRFIEAMPIEPASSVWCKLFTACRVHGCQNLAIHAGEKILGLEPGNSLIRHLVLQTYTLRGRPDDELRVKKLQVMHQLPKLIGESWVEIRNTVHSFVSGDMSKPYSNLLVSWIDGISQEIKEEELQGLCITDEENEDVSGLHSEKLVLAFAFVSSAVTPQTIRIVKNMRICGDFHQMAKYISLKYGCVIYTSHPGCFHYFKGGRCSCGDYW